MEAIRDKVDSSQVQEVKSLVVYPAAASIGLVTHCDRGDENGVA